MFMQNLLSYAAVKRGRYSYYTSKALGYTALEDVAESAAVILMEGPKKHSGKDYWFSADVLTPNQVAEAPVEATGRKFRSEERRVGKSVDLGGRRSIKKKRRRNNWRSYR